MDHGKIQHCPSVLFISIPIEDEVSMQVLHAEQPTVPMFVVHEQDVQYNANHRTCHWKD